MKKPTNSGIRKHLKLVATDISCEEYGFLNQDMINEYIQTSTLPSHKELARRHGKAESKISLHYHNLLTKLQELK